MSIDQRLPRSPSIRASSRSPSRKPRRAASLIRRWASGLPAFSRKRSESSRKSPSSPKPRRPARKMPGPKLPLRPRHVRAIRAKLQLEKLARDLAMFDLPIDSKLRGCDLVALRVDDVASNGYTIDRATIRQMNTGRPVRLALRCTGSTASRTGPLKSAVPLRLRGVSEVDNVGKGVIEACMAHLLPETRYAKSGNVHIAYQLMGNGPLDLVLVAGFVTHLELQLEDPRPVRFFERLSSFCRLMRFDKRGTGLSDRIGGIPTLEERMDDVRAVLDTIGSERAALLGFSEGGPMIGPPSEKPSKA